MTIGQILAATDIESLTAARIELGEPSPDDFAVAQDVVDNWQDAQAVSNLLMHPDLLPAATRVPTVIRGLEDVGYVQVAAAVGSGLVPAPIADDDRVALVDALLDLMAGQVGLAARRASLSVGGLLRSGDAAEVVVLLGHPDEVVRRNLQGAVIELLGPAGLNRLLDDRSQVRAEDADIARAELESDGIELDSDFTFEDVPPLAEPLYLPSLADFDGD